MIILGIFTFLVNFLIKKNILKKKKLKMPKENIGAFSLKVLKMLFLTFLIFF